MPRVNHLMAALVLVPMLTGCGNRSRAVSPPVSPAISGDRALDLTRAFVELGPRASGTTGAAKAADWLAGKCRELGYETDIDEWTEDTVNGVVTFRNVRATLPGKREGIVVAGSHYDTKVLADVPDFVGANDSGSSTGLLLTVMEALREAVPWQGCTIEFVFFDGEECVERYGAKDGLHGSKRFAASLKQSGRVASCRAMLLLDMIGDRDLNVTLPTDTDAELAQRVFRIADERGVREHFGYYVAGGILDDHTPFQRLGIPSIDFIDFEYGPDNRHWHTGEDTMDKLSSASLAAVGTVFVQLLLETAHQ